MRQARVFIISVVTALSSVAVRGQNAHSANVAVGDDPSGAPNYIGISHPSGSLQINLAGSAAGFLNAISGTDHVSGTSPDTSYGGFGVNAFPVGSTEVVAVAITVADTAGPSHSLSSLNDPALADIVSDLNAGATGGTVALNVYAFGSAPSQFNGAEAALSAGEAANGGKIFDIVVTGVPLFPGQADPPQWAFDFSNEVGNLDGITSLSVTDVGAITTPEPGTVSVIALALGGIALSRRRNTGRRLDGITSLSVTDIGAIATPEPSTIGVVTAALVGLALR